MINGLNMNNWKNEIENLRNLIEVEKIPYDTIGKMYGVSGTMIRKVWKKNGYTLEKRRRINESETFNRGKKIKTTKEKVVLPKKEKKKTKNKQELYCVMCGKKLTGKQRKYCSIQCKRKDLSKQKYHTKYARKKDSTGMDEKIKIIKEMGGKCELCGYNKNIAALCFHHKDSSLKKFTVDSRNIVRHSKETVMKELENCQLLCQNCHHEIHHPQYNGLL